MRYVVNYPWSRRVVLSIRHRYARMRQHQGTRDCSSCSLCKPLNPTCEKIRYLSLQSNARLVYKAWNGLITPSASKSDCDAEGWLSEGTKSGDSPEGRGGARLARFTVGPVEHESERNAECDERVNAKESHAEARGTVLDKKTDTIGSLRTVIRGYTRPRFISLIQKLGTVSLRIRG